MTDPRPSPAPGLHRDISPVAYREWSAASHSGLTVLGVQSAAHMQHRLQEPPDPSAGQAFGGYVHVAALAPDRFAEEFVQGPAARRDSKVFKAAIEANPGRTVLPLREWERVQRAAEALRRHPEVGPRLAECTVRSAAIAWRDWDTGVLCKARLDAATPELDLVLELTTTSRADFDAFQGVYTNLGYYRKAALVDAGVETLRGRRPRVLIAAVEDDGVFGVSVYQPDEESLELGRHELRALLNRYAECERTGHWPSYSPEVLPMSIAPWRAAALRRSLQDEGFELRARAPAAAAPRRAPGPAVPIIPDPTP